MGYALMVVGGAVLGAALFNLNIVMDSDRAGFLASALGDLGWRLTVGVLGTILLLVGIDLTWQVF